MKYHSTRDKDVKYTFEQAICSGYAPDGGLFVPESLPRIGDRLESWKDLSFTELAVQVLESFVDIPLDDLKKICTKAFQDFPEEPIPIVRANNLAIAELFHGPTFCFKDFGMRAVIGFLGYYATKNDQDIILLVSTTGDTGPAAVRAVADLENPRLKILVHFPKGQISEFQRRQMTCVDSSCVRVATFEGGGDDMDQPIKNIQAEYRSNTEGANITGVNSYNIGRPLVQAVHFIYIYLKMATRIGDPLDFIVPTGAMGNVAGGFMAKQMGLPVGKMKVGVNANDITHRAISNGDFSRAPTMVKTLSDAINIQVPYNFERVLYYVTMNSELLRKWYTEMDDTKRIQLDSETLSTLQANFESVSVDDAEMCATLREYYEEHGYLSDPHTAVALHAAKILEHSPNSVVISTASPRKFQESVTIAAGEQAWDKYVEGLPDYKAFLAQPEQPVSVYPFSGTLEASQANWEALAKKILAGLM